MIKSTFALLFISFCSIAGFSQIYINEFVASNEFSYPDDSGEYNDWVEIRNAGNSAINIAGKYFTDDFSNPLKWKIPTYDASKTTIPAGGYLVFFFDGDVQQGILHADMKLSRSGEMIGLFEPDGFTIIDSVTYSQQQTDVSQGRELGSNNWMFYQNPTPNTVNNTTAYSGTVQHLPIFNIDGGMFNLAQSVTISNPGSGIVRYTLDGSDPKASSPVYTGAISITQTKIVKAKIFQSGYFPSKPVVNTYFINEALDTRSFPVFSLSTDPDFLYDHDTGLYVQNFKPTWEHPVYVEMYDGNDNLVWEQAAGFEVLGQNSWVLPQKMLGINCNSKYGDGDLNYQLFEDRQRDNFNNFILRAAGSDWSKTLYRDGFIQSLTREAMDIDIQGYKPAIAYLNGVYHGIHNVRSKLNGEYVKQHYGIAKSNMDLIENNGYIAEGDSLHYIETKNFLLGADLSDSTQYNIAKTYFDIDNFIENYIMQFYTANISWEHNIKWWRKRSSNGKWRIMLQDLDRGFDKSTAHYNFLQIHTDPVGFPGLNPQWATLPFRKLIENEEFRNRFISKYADHLYTTFNDDLSLYPKIDSMTFILQTEIPFHSAKWAGTTSSYGDGIPNLSFWYQEVQELRDFVEQRDTVARNNFINHFNLAGTDSMYLEAIDDYGRIKINDIILPQANWGGHYIKDLELELTAIPHEGYVFNRWLVVGDTLTDAFAQTIKVKHYNDVEYFALFDPDSTIKNSPVINEIAYNPGNGYGSGEWVELYNPYSYPLDLSNWTISDTSGNEFIFPNNTVLNQDDYLIVSSDKIAFNNDYPYVQNLIGNFNFGLANYGDLVLLKDENGIVKDSVFYNYRYPWPELATIDGYTIELVGPTLPNEFGNNWKQSPLGGTPGLVNSVNRIHLQDIPNQAINFGDTLVDIPLNNYVFDPTFNLDSLTWSSSSNNISITIDPATKIASLSYGAWRGSEVISFSVSNPNNETATDSLRVTIGTVLGSIGCNETLTQVGSPYVITNNAEVPYGCSLTINEGVELGLNRDVIINVNGTISVNGTESNPVTIKAYDHRFGSIFLDSSLTASNFNYVNMSGGAFGTIDSTFQNAAISSYYSKVDITNCHFENNKRCIYGWHGDFHLNNNIFESSNIGEKANLQFGFAITENCIFKYTYGDNDGIDYDAIVGGIIRNNQFLGGEDDGIDIGQISGVACNGVEVYSNYVDGFADKGVSVGEGSENIQVHHNVLINNDLGVAVKDYSNAYIQNNTIDGNRIGVTCYQKNFGEGGGIALVSNCIISNSIENTEFADAVSQMNINYCLSNTDIIYSGHNNLYLEPHFVDIANKDYNLTAVSKAIDAGDPNSTNDPDNTVADLGAFYFTGSDQDLVVSVYPNPTASLINIEVYLKENEDVNLTITDINGKIIHNKQINKSDLNGINNYRFNYDLGVESAGVFFLNVVTEQEIITQKIMLIK